MRAQGLLRFSPTSLSFHPAALWVDAGIIGSDTTAGVGRGVGVAQFSVIIADPDGGVSVVSSLDGGICRDRCAWAAWTDPSGPTVVRLTSQEHILYNAPKFTPSRPTCTAMRCDLPLDREFQAVTVSRDLLALAFITPQAYQGALGGLSGADGLCQQAAQTEGIPGQFAALLWTSNGGAGWNRFDAGYFIFWPDGGLAEGFSDGGLGMSIFPGNVPIWSGAGNSFQYNCGDWTSLTGTGALGTSFFTPNNITLSNCSSPARLLCLSLTGATPQSYDGAATIFAAPTSGLKVNFQAECEATGAVLGLTYVRPFVAQGGRPACRSFTFAADGGVGDAGFFGSLYRADGVRVMMAAQALENCTTSGAVPTLMAPEGWAVSDAGRVELADARPVKTAGEGYLFGTISGGTNCLDWTSLTGNHRFYGNATISATQDWWAGYNYIPCGLPSYIYCVGHR